MRAFTLLSLLATVAACTLSTVRAHGYLSSPPPRGIQKATYDVDDLKAPNTKGLCRGEPVGQITNVTPGQSLTLGFTITAPHIGPCNVTLLDANMQYVEFVAQKDGCAAPGKVGPWVITLPKNAHGRMILRWAWEAQHVTPYEHYEQCVDLNFGGSGGGNDDDSDNQPQYPGSAPQNSGYAPQYSGSAPQYSGSAPQNQAPPPDFPPPSSNYASDAPSGGACDAGSYMCNSDGGFSQCANGSWVVMGCAAGTACRPTSPTAIICDTASSSSSPTYGSGDGQSLSMASPEENEAQPPPE